jgi:hypothetical protein
MEPIGVFLVLRGVGEPPSALFCHHCSSSTIITPSPSFNNPLCKSHSWAIFYIKKIMESSTIDGDNNFVTHCHHHLLFFKEEGKEEEEIRRK